jgi:hypothetical protein
MSAALVIPDAPILTKEPLDEMLRVRCTKRMKKRVKALAAKRLCDDSDVAREAVERHLEAEEIRLGIVPPPTEGEDYNENEPGRSPIVGGSNGKL